MRLGFVGTVAELSHWHSMCLPMQAAASGSLADKLAAHLEALWPVCDVVAALDGNEGAMGHAQSRAAKHGKGGFHVNIWLGLLALLIDAESAGHACLCFSVALLPNC